MIRQLVEKGMKFKSIVMYFIDLTKAYDRIKLKDVIETLKEENISEDIVHIIKKLNTNTTMHILVLVNNSLKRGIKLNRNQTERLIQFTPLQHYYGQDNIRHKENRSRIQTGQGIIENNVLC